MASRQNAKEQLKDALQTIDALREQLDQKLNPDPSATFLDIAQDARDALAVRALLMHSADMYAALRQLGFDTKDRGVADLRAMAKLVFDTEGVRKRLTANLEDFEGQKAAMIARQVQIALHGTDENSTRAFATLARTLGWQKTPEVTFVNNRSTNVWQLFNEAPSAQPTLESAKPASGFVLDYEPGEPMKIDVAEDMPDGVVESDE